MGVGLAAFGISWWGHEIPRKPLLREHQHEVLLLRANDLVFRAFRLAATSPNAGLPAILAVGGLATEQSERPLIRLPAVKLRNGRAEYWIRGYLAEQRHGRTGFEVVGTAKDFSDGAAIYGIDEVRTLPEPGSQDAMPEIGDSLLARADGKPLCHRAIPEARKLGEDEPHPVALFLAASQFSKYSRIDRLLRIDETLQTEGIAHSADL